MAISLNHTIVAARDKKAAALFLTEILGLERPPLLMEPFAVVQLGETSLDFINAGEVHSQHYAFLVSEAEFDQIFGRIQSEGLGYWADPGLQEPGEINTWDDGRGVYFQNPDGHLLEIITRPYGSAGTKAAKPHPLIASAIKSE